MPQGSPPEADYARTVEVIAEVWQRVVTTQPPPSDPIVALMAAAATALVLFRPAWVRTRHVITIAHEGAHGFAALVTGRKLGGIRLHSDTSGVTVSSGKPRGFGMVLTAFSGYVGPGLIGLATAWLVARGYSVGVLWLTLALLALLLVQIRNWFGLWSVLVTGAIVFAVSWWMPAPGQSAFAYVVVWFLLIASPRPVVELQAQRARRGTPTSDADQLARLTGLPGIVWVGLFLLVTLGSLGLGSLWMLSS